MGKAAKVGNPRSLPPTKVASSSKAMGSRVEEWASMIADPYGCRKVVKSPSACPVLGSKARIVKTYEFKHDTVDDGNFALVARPSFKDPIIVAEKVPRIPLAGYTTAKIFSPSEKATHFDKGFTYLSGAVEASADGISRLLHFESIALGATAARLALFTAYPGSATNVWTLSVQPESNTKPVYVRAYYATGSVWIDGPVVSVLPNTTTQLLSLTNAAHYFGVGLCDASGAYISNEGADAAAFHCRFYLSGSEFAFQASSSSSGLTSFVRPELIEAAHVRNARITAMSVLCTNTAAATEDGGLLVSACTSQSLLTRVTTVKSLMDATMELPETNRWQRSIVRSGAYAFYTPDDLDSYEPHDISENSLADNCVYVAGQMDAMAGSVTVLVTFIVEFYTPVQLFERTVGPTWSLEYELVLRYLQMSRCASQNDSHEDLTAQIARKIKAAVKWALDNRETLVSLGQIAVSLL